MSTVTKPVLTDETGQGIISAINSLEAVIKKTGTLTITDTGTYDVTSYGYAAVNMQKPITATSTYIPPASVDLAITSSHTEE